MICQVCGIEAPTKHVSFHQNIGLLVLRMHRSVEGRLCKTCIHKEFWKKTLINATLGWWGLISLIVTPFFILNNIVRYAMCATLPPVPTDASVPVLDERAVQRLEGVTDRMIERINKGEPIEDVLKVSAGLAGVTTGQAHLYFRSLVAASKEQQG